MKTTIISRISLIAVLILLLSSCEKLNNILDVTPRQSIDSRTALESPEAIEAALNSIYAYLLQTSQYGLELIALPELLADNSEHTNNPTSYYSEYRNQPGFHMNIWGSSYYAINEVNNILKVLQDPPLGANTEFVEKISGQAHFLRALYYHNISKIYGYDPKSVIEEVNYGSVPILLDPVLNKNEITYPARATQEQVYELIYNDLDSAYNALSGKSINSNDPQYYASDAAAAALLSRVALYNEDYPKVITEVEKALALCEGSFMSNSNYIQGWRSIKLPESIFEVVFKMGDVSDPANSSLRVAFTSRQTLTSTTFSNRGNMAVAPDLYNKYSAQDVRQELFISGLGRNANRKEITKYISRTGTNHDNVPVIRVSELYLNRAEAYFFSDQEELAINDLNKIRVRAGLDPAPYSLSGDDLLNEIDLQRRLELAFEGHRFFDLKRRGKDIIKPMGNVRFNEYRILAPIPYTETQRNTNLKQNFGY
ncbi:MAG: RagB/SusD family nutrient uptake outer membrane protein [Bacteroidales bacterium]